VPVKGGVEAAVGVVADHGDIVLAAVVAGAGDDDLAIPVDGHAVGAIIQGANGSRQHAGPAKGGVETPVGVIADESEVVGAPDVAIAGDDDLAVAVDGDASGHVIAGTDVGGYLSCSVKGGVETAVGVVPDHGKIIVGCRAGARAGNDDLAVAVDGHAL